MKDTCIEKKNTRILIVGLLMVGLCILFAAWQGSVSTSLHKTLVLCEAKVSDLQEQTSAMKTKVAKLITPEYVNAQASVRNVALMLSDASEVTKVAHAQ